MKCPKCAHVSDTALLKCSACGEVYDRAVLENLQHLEYLVRWLDAPGSEITEAARGQLRAEALQQLDAARAALNLAAPATVTAPPPPVTVPSPAPAAVPVAPPAPQPVTFSARPAATTVPAVGTVTAPAPAPPPKPIAPPAPPARPAPRPAPKPAAPPINWAKAWEQAWEFVVSGALLRGLLYLGAFMIVASAIVLVVVYWRVFPPLLRLSFVAAVPLSFYGGGFFLRERLKILIAGGVFIGIGALLVAVDFAAVYQLGGLARSVDLKLYWLVASLVCTAVYIFTAWRVAGEFFAYLTLIGGTSIAVALTSVLGLPLEWRIAAVTASAAGMVGGAARFKSLTGRWGDLPRAARRLPQLLMPVTLFLVIVLHFWVPGNQAWGQAAILELAALGYAVLAGAFPAAFLGHAAVWCSIGALGFALSAVNLPGEWYALAAALAAPVYLGVGWWIEQRLPADFSLRRSYLSAVNLTGLGLALVAVVAGLITVAFDWWPGVSALALAASVLGLSAYRFRQPLLVLVVSGLFCVPFSLAIGRWLVDAEVSQWAAWLMAAWAGLALAYLGVAVLLRRADKYGMWLNLWAHGLAPATLIGLAANYVFTADAWFNGPTLIALGGVLGVYVASAVLHDSGRHPALSRFVNWIPLRLGRAIFLWPIGLLIPVELALAWWGSVLQFPWLGAVLAGLALAYVGAGQWLMRRKIEYRLPLHTYAYALILSGIITAYTDHWSLLTALYLGVAVLGTLAFTHRRAVETALAALLFLWPFQLSLDLSPLTPHAHALAYALLASLGYVPLGLALDRVARKHAFPLYVVGYGVSGYAVIASLLGRFGGYPLDVPWIGVAVPLVVTGLYVFSAYRFRQWAFAWASALVFPIVFGQTLTLLRVRPDYDMVAWVGLALVYMLTERVLHRTQPAVWLASFRWPLGVGAVVLVGLGLLLAAPGTIIAFVGESVADYVPLILAPTLAMVMTVLTARLYRSPWPLFVEPALAFVALTLGFIGYSALPSVQFSIVWAVLALVHLLVAVLLDRSRARYAHGLYLGGYLLLPLAVAWTLYPVDYASLVWAFGLSLVAAIGSALLVHFNWHRTWDEVIGLIFGQTTTTLRAVVRGAFLWVAAWLFPLWSVLFLRQIRVADGFYWLGFGGSALVFLGLAVWLKRFDRTYGWPLHSAAQVYTIAGLLVSVPLTVKFLSGDFARLPENLFLFLEASGFVVLQTAAVGFYAASAKVFQRRFFAHLAAWLTFFPYTLAWIVYAPGLASVRFAWVWTGLAAALLVLGFALDRARVRYAHGPYLAGYVLSSFALLWSAPDRLTNLYTLGAVILIALASHGLAHSGRHRSFDDVIRFIGPLRQPITVAGRTARTAFLFFAAYAFPVWLAQLLTYFGVELAWRGLALAMAAPIYVAFGLAMRRTQGKGDQSIAPTWPLYSAGYALTAIGAMVSFENEALAIYVLALDAVVYAASAYIFRQAFWLYLSSALLPVVVLLTLHHTNALTAPWVAGLFMGLAFLYFLIGQWFDWPLRVKSPQQKREVRPPLRIATGAIVRGLDSIAPFALPFYAPGYVLSAVALAVAATPDRVLALEVYSAGVVLYALSAWAFKESVLLYPAAWLAAVPYYLLMTFTGLPPQWYGLGWLPLIVGYIALGRFMFQKAPLGVKNLRTFFGVLTRSPMPFYLLAYALSVSMMVISQHSALTLTLAFAAGAVVYFGSAALFRRPAWLYPGLLAAHLALLVSLAIHPTGKPAYYATLPFLGLTWVVALVGYGFSRHFPVTRETKMGHRVFKFGRWELDFGIFPFVGHLLTPSWAQPFFIFAAFDVIFWQALALYGFETGILLAVGFAILIGLFAMLWRDTALAYGMLVFFLLAVGYRLGWAGVALADSFAVVGGIGFGLYLVARVAERIAAGARPKHADAVLISTLTVTRTLSVWPRPLTNAAVALTALAALVTLPTITSHITASAAALAFAGALYLTIAFRGRYYRLGYAAVAMLQLAWALLLSYGKIAEPQLYAIPAGLYLTGVGFLERRRGRKLFAIGIESLGMAVLLLTSFIQSLRGGAGGVPYFVMLLVEALLVIWWGAARRLKVPFFIGFGASALNVIGQVVVLFTGGSTLTRWLIIGGAGLLIITVAVFVERQRARIIAKAQEWREALERWE